jgi:hypothetical protein
MIAIGLSGLVAGGLGLLFGKSFVSGDVEGVAYTESRCAEFQEYYPSPTCEAAATAHHFDEVVSYRVAAGVLGLLALASLVGLALLKPGLFRDAAGLDPALTPAVGAALFGLGAAGLLGMGTLQLVFAGAAGTGALISGGLVAAVAFAVYARSLLRSLA